MVLDENGVGMEMVLDESGIGMKMVLDEIFTFGMKVVLDELAFYQRTLLDAIRDHPHNSPLRTLPTVPATVKQYSADAPLLVKHLTLQLQV